VPWRNERPSVLPVAEAVAQTPGDATGSLLRVGSEIGHLVRRERPARRMASQLAKLDLLAGYAAAFALVGIAQASVVATYALTALGLDTTAHALAVVALAAANALLGMSLGLLASAFARTEFQATQFMPAFILPQLLLCGLFIPRERMAGALETLADALPATYAYDALDRLASDGALGSRGTLDLAVVVSLTVLALVLGAATLRRRTA
jgi:ABC-2 type transport system permease protein